MSMNSLFHATENRVLAFLSTAIVLNTVFFIAREVDPLNFLIVSNNTHIFYFIYVALGLSILGSLGFYATSWSWREWIVKILIALFPTIILLIFALSESIHFHYVFQIGVGIYVITAGFLLIHIHHKNNLIKENASNKTPSPSRNKKIALVLLTLLVSANIGLGSYQIANFAAVDEALWTFGKRISKYWVNIGERKWNSTKVSDKPGVTVSIISGAGLLSVNPKTYKPVKWEGSTVHSTKDIREMNFALRFPILLFASLSLFLFYFFLERLFGYRKALVSTILIGTSPILVGMARIINPDSLLWIFGPLSMVSYLTFMKRKALTYLYWAGIFLGLALLTKYVANILFVFFFGLLFFDYIFKEREERNSIDFVHFIKTSFLHYAILTFVALAVFYILYPAVWVKPSRLLNATLLSQAFESTWPLFIGIISFIFLDQWTLKNRITKALLDFLAENKRWIVLSILALFTGSVLFALLNTFTGMSWYDFPAILSSPKSSYAIYGFMGIFLGNFYPLIFGIHPIALLSLPLLSIFIIRNSTKLSHTYLTSLALIIFILLYYLGTTVNHVATIFRYQIMLFPTILILAGVALSTLFRMIEKRFPSIHFTVLASGLFLLTVSSLVLASPLYMGYASGLLPQQYHIDIKDMGTGSYEAAAYLNSLPNAKHITIWTDKSGVCIFFDGSCYSSFNFSSLKEKSIDYVVVSSGRQSRTEKMINPAKPNVIRFDQYYQHTDAVYELLIDNRPSNFVKVLPFHE